MALEIGEGGRESENTSFVGNQTVQPSWIDTGVLGIALTIRGICVSSCSQCTGLPVMTDSSTALSAIRPSSECTAACKSARLTFVLHCMALVGCSLYHLSTKQAAGFLRFSWERVG